MSDRDDVNVDNPAYGTDRDSPNTDFGNKVNPPADVEMERISDDNDLRPQGEGTAATHLRRPYELMARRDDISRRLGEIVVSAQEWAEEDGSDEARSIADDLEDVYERLGEPSEDTDRTLGMPHLEGEEPES